MCIVFLFVRLNLGRETKVMFFRDPGEIIDANLYVYLRDLGKTDLFLFK
jgi:hypothetical protein